MQGNNTLRPQGLPARSSPRLAGRLLAAVNGFAIPLVACASTPELSFQSFVARGDPEPPLPSPPPNSWGLSLSAHSTPPRLARTQGP